MGEKFTSRLAGGLPLLAVTAAMTLGAVFTGRGMDALWAAAVAVPLASVAALLHGSPVTALVAEALTLLGFIGLGAVVGGPLIALAVFIGMVGIVYAPRVRRARESRHRVGLAGMIAALILAAQVTAAGVAPPTAGDEDAFTLLINLAWLVPAITLCAGWPQRRSFGACLARLGVVRPTVREVGAATGIACLLVLMVAGLSAATQALFELGGWATTSDNEVRTTFAALMNPLGILVIAVTAGIGEELFVRGLLQPRYGLVLPAVFFTGLHAGQYRLDALIPLLALSLVLGWVRRRWHTTASIVVHAVYDLLIGALLLLSTG